MRLEINYMEKNIKNTHTWRLNNMLLNNQKITEEIKGEIKKHLETNDNENTTIQNLWDAAKAVLRGKFIAIQAYLKKDKDSIKNWMVKKKCWLLYIADFLKKTEIKKMRTRIARAYKIKRTYL